jgi:hypothetical protein
MRGLYKPPDPPVRLAMIETMRDANRSADRTSEIRHVAIIMSQLQIDAVHQGAEHHNDHDGGNDDAEYHGGSFPF